MDPLHDRDADYPPDSAEWADRWVRALALATEAGRSVGAGDRGFDEALEQAIEATGLPADAARNAVTQGWEQFQTHEVGIPGVNV